MAKAQQESPEKGLDKKVEKDKTMGKNTQEGFAHYVLYGKEKLPEDESKALVEKYINRRDPETIAREVAESMADGCGYYDVSSPFNELGPDLPEDELKKLKLETLIKSASIISAKGIKNWNDEYMSKQEIIERYTNELTNDFKIPPSDCKELIENGLQYYSTLDKFKEAQGMRPEKKRDKEEDNKKTLIDSILKDKQLPPYLRNALVYKYITQRRDPNTIAREAAQNIAKGNHLEESAYFANELGPDLPKNELKKLELETLVKAASFIALENIKNNSGQSLSKEDIVKRFTQEFGRAFTTPGDLDVRLDNISRLLEEGFKYYEQLYKSLPEKSKAS